MEDSGFEWIIYGIAMLVGVIGMINKARKQAKQQQQAPPQPSQFPWEAEEYETQETYSPQPAPASPSQPQWQNIPPQVISERSFDTKGEAMREMVATEGGRTTYDKALAKQKHGRHQHSEHIDDHTDNAIDFDLRKAVIYSEILKPKYNEY